MGTILSPCPCQSALPTLYLLCVFHLSLSGYQHLYILCFFTVSIIFLVSIHHTGAEGWRGGGGEEGEAKGNIWRRETERADRRWNRCHWRRHKPQWAACAEWPWRRRQRVWVGVSVTVARTYLKLERLLLHKQPLDVNWTPPSLSPLQSSPRQHAAPWPRGWPAWRSRGCRGRGPDTPGRWWRPQTSWGLLWRGTRWCHYGPHGVSDGAASVWLQLPDADGLCAHRWVIWLHQPAAGKSNRQIIVDINICH